MTDLGTDLDGVPVLVRHAGSPWHAPAVSAYRDEAHLEALLADQPELLPGVGQGAVAVRQLYVPATGPLDVIAVDLLGEITVCECKLAKNPEIRRAIVGQVFAYAAGLWRLSFDGFDSLWRDRTGGRSLIESLSLDASSTDAFRTIVAGNLDVGRFRLVLAVDEITPELRRMVEFLNAHTLAETTVVALELGYGNEEGVEILVPRVYGAELAAAKRRTASAAQTWSQEDLFEWLARNQPEVLVPIRQLLDRFEPQVDHYFYGVSKTPAATAIVKNPLECQPFSVWTSDAGWVGVSVNFEWMHRLGDIRLRRLLDRLEAIPSVRPIVSGVAEAGFKKRPTIKWSVLSLNDTFAKVMDALDEALQPSETVYP